MGKAFELIDESPLIPGIFQPHRGTASGIPYLAVDGASPWCGSFSIAAAALR
jgi:hypothetical protein